MGRLWEHKMFQPVIQLLSVIQGSTHPPSLPTIPHILCRHTWHYWVYYYKVLHIINGETMLGAGTCIPQVQWVVTLHTIMGHHRSLQLAHAHAGLPRYHYCTHHWHNTNGLQPHWQYPPPPTINPLGHHINAHTNTPNVSSTQWVNGGHTTWGGVGHLGVYTGCWGSKASMVWSNK